MVAQLLWEQRVGSSNLLAPTKTSIKTTAYGEAEAEVFLNALYVRIMSVMGRHKRAMQRLLATASHTERFPSFVWGPLPKNENARPEAFSAGR